MVNDTEQTTNAVSTMMSKLMKERQLQPNITADTKGI